MAQRLFDEIKRLIDDTMSGVHTAMPGTITSQPCSKRNCSKLLLPRGANLT